MDQATSPRAPSPPGGAGPGPTICLACFGERLAALLETAGEFRLYATGPKGPVAFGALPRPSSGLAAAAGLLALAGIRRLVCGGASRESLELFRRAGITVLPWLGGDIPTVLAALAARRVAACRLPGRRGRGLGRGPRIGQNGEKGRPDTAGAGVEAGSRPRADSAASGQDAGK